jgi:hypothetical protein
LFALHVLFLLIFKHKNGNMLGKHDKKDSASVCGLLKNHYNKKEVELFFSGALTTLHLAAHPQPSTSFVK